MATNKKSVAPAGAAKYASWALRILAAAAFLAAGGAKLAGLGAVDGDVEVRVAGDAHAVHAARLG